MQPGQHNVGNGNGPGQSHHARLLPLDGHGLTNRFDLQVQRQHDTCRLHGRKHGGRLLAPPSARIVGTPAFQVNVADEELLELHRPRPGRGPEVAGLQEDAECAGGQGEDVEEEDGRAALGGAGQGEEGYEEEEREAGLETKVEGVGGGVAEVETVVCVDGVGGEHGGCYWLSDWRLALAVG